MRFQTLFSLLPALAIPANAYFILSHPILETTRLDPIVNPGAISSHVHSVVGGNNFDKTMSYASTQDSTCSTAAVQVDKSNYWTPQLYYYSPTDETYQLIPAAGVNTYYLPRYSKGETTVRAFPDGLRMISGNPYRRTYDSSSADDNAVSYVCLDYDNNHSGDPAWAQRNSFFEHNCPNGMRAQVFFRSCWDGVNLDSPDHQSHMAWPSGGVDGGDCPSTHPVRLVSLFYEFIYNVQDFPHNGAGNVTWVFATGDTTGYSMHGDFLNGWPAYSNGTNVLQQALDQCNDNNGVGGELNNCPPFVPYLDSSAASACKPLNDLVNEDVGKGHTLSKLPGNNPLWVGNTPKPSYANYTGDNDLTYTDFKSTIPTGYTEVGCIAEATSGRALAGATFTSSNMTRGVCVQWCEDRGYPLAGIEYGTECYCDFTMRNGASNTTLLDSSKCNKVCANNDNENCGGSSTLSLFNNPSLYPQETLPAGWTSSGCMTEATSGRALSRYSISGGTINHSVCIAACAAKGYTIAGIEYGRECYCGNSFNAGSVAAPDAKCNMACAGNSLQTCGGSSVLTTFTYSNGTTTSSSSSAAASTSASSAAASSSSSKAATSTSAVVSSSGVSSSKAATSTSTAISSTSSSVSKVASTSTVASTSAVASTTSSNGATSTSASASSTSAAASSVVASSTVSSAAASASASSASTISSLYMGCYSEYTNRHLNGTSTTSSSMTNEVCIAYCSNKGYAYAGTEYYSECYCGNYLNTAVKRDESTCSYACAGDSTEFCGKGGVLSIYKTGLSGGVQMTSQYSRRSSAKWRL